MRLKVRSMVGLLPLAASIVVEESTLEKLPGFRRRAADFLKRHPELCEYAGHEYRVDYLPGESDSGMFGGNSNWRGPVWMPVNFLLFNSLWIMYSYFGDSFKIECPTGSGNLMDLYEVSMELARRLSGIFLRDDLGRRPLYGGTEKFQTDEHWRELLLFYEYFNADNGAGMGASHQTGWTHFASQGAHFQRNVVGT
jgi:hypothetical protein